ncbi:hypothetical protein HYALB_00007318 [Hymenoscyphus albidus]|uniref:RNA exonuclease 4 n=1 Tax=Hymenoscyphus albidus TaxID=595503 RepID=A0A9N9LGH4_9HELO|nr:hypothetical protein HYALB_00007318 [Hymenoscyphus albidus]
MAPELSSNWKKLQAQLKQESAAKSERKRKGIPTERQQNTIAKRRRLEGKTPTATSTSTSKSISASTKSRSHGILKKKRKMGLGASTESPPAEPPTTNLASWAEDNDISARDLADAYGPNRNGNPTSTASTTVDKINCGLVEDVEIGKYIALDCEMVGVDGPLDRSVLARISIVNFHGHLIYDSFVKPEEFVTDWRTPVSGIAPRHIVTARQFDEVQTQVAEIMKDRIIVGHAIKNDLDVLMLTHPKKDIRDTSKYPGFRKYATGRTPSLKILAAEILGLEIQSGEHSSIEDARAAMLLMRRHKSGFDVDNAQRFPSMANGRARAKGGGGGGGKKKKKGKRG